METFGVPRLFLDAPWAPDLLSCATSTFKLRLKCFPPFPCTIGMHNLLFCPCQNQIAYCSPAIGMATSYGYSTQRIQYPLDKTTPNQNWLIISCLSSYHLRQKLKMATPSNVKSPTTIGTVHVHVCSTEWGRNTYFLSISTFPIGLLHLAILQGI